MKNHSSHRDPTDIRENRGFQPAETKPEISSAGKLLIAGIVRSWFSLTAREQKALLTVITIALIGMIVAAWHKAGFRQEPPAEKNKTQLTVK